MRLNTTGFTVHLGLDRMMRYLRLLGLPQFPKPRKYARSLKNLMTSPMSVLLVLAGIGSSLDLFADSIRAKSALTQQKTKHSANIIRESLLPHLCPPTSGDVAMSTMRLLTNPQRLDFLTFPESQCTNQKAVASTTNRIYPSSCPAGGV